LAGEVKGKIQSSDGGWISHFLLPFRRVAANQKHHKILGETIRTERKKARLSQEKLAEKADLHHNYIGEIERGEKAATIDTIVKIAKALGLRTRDLVRDI
jgi:ribosome-binding protein aMBF1 (putative translation factor)